MTSYEVANPNNARMDPYTEFAANRLLIFAKAPVAGLAKTRLIPILGVEGAARLQSALIDQTLRSCCEASRHAVELWCAPDNTDPFFIRCAERFGVTLRVQRGCSLGERMFHALRSALRFSGAAVLVGTDVPTLTSADLCSAVDALRSGADAVLAPAFDGGYVLIGLTRIDPRLFRDVEWGTDRVLEQTRQRLLALNYSWRELRTHHDIDRPEDWERLTAMSPQWLHRLNSPPAV